MKQSRRRAVLGGGGEKQGLATAPDLCPLTSGHDKKFPDYVVHLRSFAAPSGWPQDRPAPTFDRAQDDFPRPIRSTH